MLARKCFKEPSSKDRNRLRSSWKWRRELFFEQPAIKALGKILGLVGFMPSPAQIREERISADARASREGGSTVPPAARTRLTRVVGKSATNLLQMGFSPSNVLDGTTVQ
jgi:hypothetical protein